MLTCAGLPKLHTLRLSGNDFRDSRHAAFFPRLPGPVCSTLRRLELRSCFLRAVPPALSHLTALTALDLSGNRTLEIERSDLEVFSRLTGLHELVRGLGQGPAAQGWLLCVCSACVICECGICSLAGVGTNEACVTEHAAATLQQCVLLQLPSLSCHTPLRLQRLGKPPGLTQGKVEWSQASVAALLDVQRACAWLRLSDALQPPPQE